MWRFLTSLTFLYAFTGVLLLLFAIWQYRDFRKGRFSPTRFQWIFIAVALACTGFLLSHFYAPLPLKTFSNLDHQFLKHDGYLVRQKLTLGQADTVNYRQAAYSEFEISKSGDKIKLKSSYSEEPGYYSNGKTYTLLSPHYAAVGNSISVHFQKQTVTIRLPEDGLIELQIGEKILQQKQIVKKAIQLWTVFRDHPELISQQHQFVEELTAALQNIYLLRNDVNRETYGELVFYVSGRLLSQQKEVTYNGTVIQRGSLAFEKELDYGGVFAWGIAFLDNNKNQVRFEKRGADSLLALPRYPVSYPLGEENRNDWNRHRVVKFMVGHHEQMTQIPSALEEGFMFAAPGSVSATAFAPVIVQYKKAAGDEPIELQVSPLRKGTGSVNIKGDSFSLPAGNGGFDWIFSVHNSFNWQFNGFSLSPFMWQLIIFGSLLFFVLMVLLNNRLTSSSIKSFVTNILATVTLVLLTTRFFLYWRYKSFPPFEGMDLPSVQQLNSVANFGIIILATVLLAFLFGVSWLRPLFHKISGGKIKLSNDGNPENASEKWKRWLSKLPVVDKMKPVRLFLAGWFLLLVLMGGLAALGGFNSSTCRHIAIALVVCYFLFLYLSYRYSPLSTEQSKAWWRLSTSRRFEMLVNNPVKILLSISLLATFLFIDIGFAIVFLNFLLFHEAFLCINYGVAGLSTGSRANASWMAGLGAFYLLLFVLNLLFAPFVFQFLLNLPQIWYLGGYIGFGVLIAYVIVRLMFAYPKKTRRLAFLGVLVALTALSWLFFPKQRILDKASMTRYRIDVLTRPAEEAIAHAYADGKNHIPVIRAAQNQWFINTFIDKDNNPHVSESGFNLLPHAPQNKGARYNAQATDLVSSRFLVAEHGQTAVLLYVCLLLLPAILLTSFYKLYPDFTSRINGYYAPVSTGFAILNYLVITALMVVLAATGRYIFFGQDLPFGSILSKQSVLFPLILIGVVVTLFKSVPAERFSHARKWLPGAAVFILLFLLLFFARPAYNRQKEFGIEGLASGMEMYVQQYLQPLLDHVDTAVATRRLSIQEKDRVFSDSLRKWLPENADIASNPFFTKEATLYANTGFGRHRDERKLLYLDLRGNSPVLAVNEQFFRVDPPPHLQSLWSGDVVGDTSVVNITVFDASMNTVIAQRLIPGYSGSGSQVADNIEIKWLDKGDRFEVSFSNKKLSAINWRNQSGYGTVSPGQSMHLFNNEVWECSADDKTWLISLQPDSYMRNYYVNGSRYYHYPLAQHFLWARNFAEAVSVDFSNRGEWNRDAVISPDYEWMDSLTAMISDMLKNTADYPVGAGYGITVADSRGQILAMADQIKGLKRVDPNDKAAFQKLLLDEEGIMRSSDWRKHLGNINTLRMNPGPGSTLKPIVFAAIASQMAVDWTAFASTGFTEKQTLFGGMKVPEYDFELNNGTVRSVADYLRLSDNYYHANLLLLGSYRKQPLDKLLSEKFNYKPVVSGLHWPNVQYKGRSWFMSGFSNWPGFEKGKADFGSDSSFTSVGLTSNFSIGIHPKQPASLFSDEEDVIGKAARQSGFVLPEWSLWDQKGMQIDHRIPYDLFLHTFRGHVKGSSQVMISPLGMTHAFGRLVSQNRNYQLSFNPRAAQSEFAPFYVDPSIPYNQYLELMRTQVFKGMKDVMERGTGAALGRGLKQGAPYYYFGKTGTTGDDTQKTKSKLFALVISTKDLSDPGHVFRDNPFLIVYFTSQNGPARQNEEFQARVVKYLESSPSFKRYMQH